jgi:hypothetical protein
MKKAIMILMVAVMALGAQAEKYISRAYQPDTNNVATITQDFAASAVPLLIYTELTGTTTNAVAVTFAPDLETNATDYAASYRIGSFSTVGGAEAPIVLNTPENTNSITTGPIVRDDALVLTGGGGTASSNVLYRVLFKVD